MGELYTVRVDFNNLDDVGVCRTHHVKSDLVQNGRKPTETLWPLASALKMLLSLTLT